LTGSERKDEALMTTPVRVVGKELRNHAFAGDLGSALPLVEYRTSCFRSSGLGSPCTFRGDRGRTGKVTNAFTSADPVTDGCNNYDYKKEFLHTRSVFHRLSGGAGYAGSMTPMRGAA
jgi:hypothetical protein